MPRRPPNYRLLRPHEAAAALGVGVRQVWYLATWRGLPFVRIGEHGQRRYPRTAVARLAREREISWALEDGGDTGRGGG